ncbi:MAG: AAA family ATPase [Hymenobacteraceae bacterium]|nr:AAA family ATPase [Hymenobacteraceae bacterium]
MNEKLTVRNFGPIKEAEVEFKRVTVFIGPTGGGKSTLAKLAAIFRDSYLFYGYDNSNAQQQHYEDLIHQYDLNGYADLSTRIEWYASDQVRASVQGGHITIEKLGPAPQLRLNEQPIIPAELLRDPHALKKHFAQLSANELAQLVTEALAQRDRLIPRVVPVAFYVPADRAFASAVMNAAAGLQNADVALPRSLLAFMAEFEVARKNVVSLPLPFFNATYFHESEINQLMLPSGRRVPLAQAASGLQAVVPVLVTLADRTQAQLQDNRAACYFFVEEPEISLFPKAQRFMLEELVSQCTKVDDMLAVNTHSPYILSHLNLLLYAHQVASQYPERAEEVTQLVPRASWINPKDFAAYYVGENDVHSIVDADSGLIDSNALDEIAGDQADAFDNLIRLTKRVSAS